MTAQRRNPATSPLSEPHRTTALENDPRFLRRIEKARKSLRAGRGVRLENVK
jgi:hypothetical protein